ncbi:extracellular solute-binding protein [Propioniciclava soli]|uniref:Extracellular solute-binding protein n=1 Tax=Propioniciclava soli TaxID=2775081 RepID=A0ABZ3C9F6_9ACTN
MRKKTTLSVAALSVMVLGLSSACAAGPQSVTQSGSQGSAGADGSQELTWSGWSDDATAAALIEQFEADNPGVTVNHVGLPWPGILTQINTELVSGTASDVVTVFPGNGNPITVQTLAKGNYLADLSDQEWVSEFSDSNKSVMTADGKVLMASNNSGIIPAIYNSAAMAEVGATPPTTWSEVMNLCATAQSNGKVAYALAGLAGGNFSHYVYALTSTLVYEPGSTFAQDMTDGTATFAGSEWSTALEQYLAMRDAGCFRESPLGTSIEVAHEQVATGEALGIVTVSQQISTIQEAAPEGAEFVTAPFPATDNAADTVLPVGLGAGYGVNAKAENPELALKLIDYYMSQEGLQTAVDVGSNFPSIPLEGYTPSAVLSGVADQAQTGKTAPYPDQLWPNANVNQVYQDQLQQLLGDRTTVADALATMDTAFTG